MDKLKPIIDPIMKYHFWVLCGVLVLVVLVCWWMATSGLAGHFDTEASKIKNAFNSLNGIQQGHPNQGVIDEAKKRDAELKQNVFQAWENLYREQDANNRFPTEDLGEDFERQFKTLRPQEELARRYRERYQNFIKERLPKLKKIIDALHPIEPEPGATGQPNLGGMAPGGEMGMMPGGGMMPGNTEAEWAGVVEWTDADYQKLESRFFWQQTPTTLAVVHAQEDLWVFEALLRVIKQTNEGATNQKNAKVKRIDSLDIGRDAVAVWKTAENALGLQSQGTGGPGSDPMMDGMGGDPGMGGGGFDEGGMGGRSEAGATFEEQLNQKVMNLRYIDDKGKPLPYQPQYPHANHPRSEFKMMPISMKLVMDQRYIPQLLVNCANSNMPIEVRRVRVLKTQGPSGTTAAHMGGGMGGGMGMPRHGAMGGAAVQQADTTQFDVPVEIHAIINIYNPPDRDKLGKGAAAAGEAGGAAAPATAL